MNKFGSVSVLSMTVVVILVAATTVSAGEGKGHGKHHHNMTCKGEAFNYKDMWVGKKECFQELYPSTTTIAPPTTDEDKKAWREAIRKHWKEADANLCYHVCILKKQKIIKEDGSYDSTEADKLVKSMFPATVQVELKKAFDECASSHSKSFSMDNKCEGYKGFKECKIKKLMEICDIKFEKEDMQEE